MVEGDRSQFGIAIGAMVESFGQEATRPLIHGYWLGLNDLTIAEVQIAIVRAIRECERLPKPADLRRFVGRFTDHEALAIDAWNDVQKALPLGPYKHLDFDDKLCNAVIRNLGGWPNFVSRFTNSEAEKWVRLEFIKAYQSFLKSGVNGEIIKPLAGLSQAEVVGGAVVDPVPRRIECNATRRLNLESRETVASGLLELKKA